MRASIAFSRTSDESDTSRSKVDASASRLPVLVAAPSGHAAAVPNAHAIAAVDTRKAAPATVELGY
jgi:hypothetical protein